MVFVLLPAIFFFSRGLTLPLESAVPISSFFTLFGSQVLFNLVIDRLQPLEIILDCCRVLLLFQLLESLFVLKDGLVNLL